LLSRLRGKSRLSSFSFSEPKTFFRRQQKTDHQFALG
jgi:hypothetical protein